MFSRLVFLPTLAAIFTILLAQCDPPWNPSDPTRLISSPTFIPTLTPEPPIETPTEIQTPIPTGVAGYQPQSVCDNPYWPLRVGATWTYQITGPDGKTSTDTITVANIESTATSTSAYLTEGEWTYPARCGSKGVWVAAPLMIAISLPEGKLIPGTSQESSSTSSFFEGGPTFTETNVIIVENGGTVVTPAGSFETVSFSWTASYAPDPSDYGEQIGINSWYADRGEIWFAVGVGFVREEISHRNIRGETKSSVFVLTSYYIP